MLTFILDRPRNVKVQKLGLITTSTLFEVSPLNVGNLLPYLLLKAVRGQLQNLFSAAPRRAQFVYFVILSPRLLRNAYCLLPLLCAVLLIRL
jgi:hypothetical protein